MLTSAGVTLESDPRRIAEYSYDASNYRVPPLAVVFPRNVADVQAITQACAATGTPLTARGGGTSMAGNAIGPGVVLDFSRYMNRVVRIDTDARIATVEPGVILTDLQNEVADVSGGALTFAPDPSSKSRASVGGAIGNDACGNHSVRHGRTSDHVVSLDLLTVDGHLLTAYRGGLCATDPSDESAVGKAAELAESMRELAAEHMGEFRLELGRIPRQVSGYHLAHLLPENGFDIARALVGSEGTCAVIVGATVALVPVARVALLLCLGYHDVVDAARDVMTVLEFSPAAVEGIDSAIVETVRHRRGVNAIAGLPAGAAWLYVTLDGEDVEEVTARGSRLLERLKADGRLVGGRTVDNPRERAALWGIREDGAGLSARLVGGGESWPGWEDSAVTPETLADYLVALRALLDDFGLTGAMYGHFGAGCVHIRIDFDQRTEHGRKLMADFVTSAATMCVEFGGSVSGEHGDGRARSAVLRIMYSATLMSAFAKFKRLWDPHSLLNPGIIVDAVALTTDLALSQVSSRPWETSFELENVPEVAGFVHAVQGCVGVGRCRSSSGGVMCPSFRATGDEKDSTRGRARALQEMVRTAPSISKGWRSEEVRESLDLCLSCKACMHDCPVGVDMATYKSEFLDHYYRGRLRPLSHYSLGWLPWWAGAAVRFAPLINRLADARMAPLAGLTSHRVLPKFASRSQLRREIGPHVADADTLLLIDTFTRGFRPEVAGASRRVLADAGRRVECRTDLCCGLTWLSTGQLSRAKKTLTRTANLLDDGTERPIVVVEPSCAAALRKDMPELLQTGTARRVASRVRSFATAVLEQVESGWRPKLLMPETVTVQTHCHEYATFGSATQRNALKAVGVSQVRETTGCCGVAGNFGFENTHYELSVKIAEQALAPALRDTKPGAAVLTDGFSCRMQVNHLEPDRPALHLAELLDPHRTEDP